MAQGIFYTLGLRTAGFTGPLAAAQSVVGRFQGSMTAMAAKAAALAAPVVSAGAAFAGIKKAIAAAADMESTGVAFKTLIGDAAKAAETINRLKQLGAETPFDFPELADAGRKLIAFGEGAETVPDTLRRIGDVASGVQAPIAEIAELYGKARVQGTLYAEDINQLLNRGIPIIQEFAAILGVSEGQVKKLASEGKIGFAALERAIIRLTSAGGRFHGMMAEQSTTTNGLLSTLQDGFGELYRIIGAPINDFLKPILEGAIDRTDRLGAGMAAFFDLLKSASEQGRLGEFLGDSILFGAVQAINVISGGIRGSVAYLAAALPAVFSAARESLFGQRMTLVIESAFRGVGEILKAAIRSAAASAASALGSGGMARDLHTQSEADSVRAATYFGTARAGLAGLTGEELAGVGKAMLEANEKGLEAYRKAPAKDMIDTSAIKARLAAVGRAVNPEAWEKLMRAARGGLVPAAEEAEKAAPALRDLTLAAEELAGKTRQAAAAPRPGGAPAEEEPGRRRMRLLSPTESAAARLARRSAADLARDARLGRDGLTQADKLGYLRGKRPNPNFPVAGLADVAGMHDLNKRMEGIHEKGRTLTRDARPTRTQPRPDRGVMDAQSRAEALLAKIESHLSRAIRA